MPVNLFFAKHAIADAVKEYTGAELAIDGPLRIRLGPRPVLTASEVRISAQNTSSHPVLQITQLQIKPRLLDVMRGDIHLRAAEFTNLVLDYCAEMPAFAGDTKPNQAAQLPSIAVDMLSIEELQPRCEDDKRRLNFIPGRLAVYASASLGQPLKLDIESLGEKQALSLNIQGKPLSELLAGPKTYPFSAQINAHGSEMTIDGVAPQPFGNPGIEVQIGLVSPRPADLLTTLGGDSTQLQGLELTAQATVKPDELELRDVKGTYGDHSFELSLLGRGFSTRPYVKVDAVLEQLDLQALGGSDGKDEDAASINDPARQPADFTPLYDALSAFDAQASIRIDHVLNAPWSIEDLVLGGSLEDGLLTLDTLNMLLHGSAVSGKATLDSRQHCVAASGELQISDFDLSGLRPFIAPNSQLGGTVGYTRLNGSSCGSTLGALVHSLTAAAEISDLHPQWAGEDLQLEFNSMAAAIAPFKPGQLKFEGRVMGTPLAAEISIGSSEEMRSGDDWPIGISAQAPDSLINLSGQAKIRNNRLELDTQLQAKITRLGSLHAWLGVDPSIQTALTLQSGMQLGERGLVLDKLNARIGQSDLRGKIALPGPKNDTPAVVSLVSEQLDIGELTTLLPPNESAEVPATAANKTPEPLSDIARIEQWFALPAVDIDLSFARLAGERYEVHDAELQGMLRNRLIEDGRLKLTFEGAELDGQLNADFRSTPWSTGYGVTVDNLDIGRLLSKLGLEQDIEAHAENLTLRYQSSGESLSQLAANAQVEARIDVLRWMTVSALTDRSFELNLTEVELSRAPFSPLIMQSTGLLNGTPLHLWGRMPTLRHLRHTDLDIPLRAVISAGQDITMVDALLSRQAQDGLTVTIDLSGTRQDPVGLDFSALEAPLQGFRIQTRIETREQHIQFTDIQAQIGDSQALGQVDLRREGPRWDFDIDLQSPFLETDDLVASLAYLRGARERVSSKAASPQADVPPAGKKAEQEGLATIINAYAAELTEKNSFRVRVGIDDLRSSGIPLGEASAELRVDDEEIRLDPMQINLPGGGINAFYLGHYEDDAYKTDVNIGIEHLNYGGPLRLLNPDSTATGEMYLDLSLSSTAPDPAHVINELQGSVDLFLVPENINAGFLDLWASNVIFAVLKAGDASAKKMNCMVARFEVENGVMKSKNTFLDTTDVIVRARGEIDLVNRQLDLLIAPQAKIEKFLSVSTPLAVDGPFDDFDVGVAPAGFLTTMIRWYYGLIYVPWKWLTGERFPKEGLATCYKAMDWPLTDTP